MSSTVSARLTGLAVVSALSVTACIHAAQAAAATRVHGVAIVQPLGDPAVRGIVRLTSPGDGSVDAAAVLAITKQPSRDINDVYIFAAPHPCDSLRAGQDAELDSRPVSWRLALSDLGTAAGQVADVARLSQVRGVRALGVAADFNEDGRPEVVGCAPLRTYATTARGRRSLLAGAQRIDATGATPSLLAVAEAHRRGARAALAVVGLEASTEYQVSVVRGTCGRFTVGGPAPSKGASPRFATSAQGSGFELALPSRAFDPGSRRVVIIARPDGAGATVALCAPIRAVRAARWGSPKRRRR